MINLYKLIRKLKEVETTSAEERKNIDINLKICDMQLEIIKKLRRADLLKN
jgi:hypothetical protein